MVDEPDTIFIPEVEAVAARKWRGGVNWRGVLVDDLARHERMFTDGHRDGWFNLTVRHDNDRYWDGYCAGALAGKRYRGESTAPAILEIEVVATRPDGTKFHPFADELLRELYGDCIDEQ